MSTHDLTLDEQADEIRDRMQRLRMRLDCEVERVREQTDNLLDWRVQVRKHPLAAAGLVAALGYLVVPGRRVTSSVRLNDESIQELVDATRELRDSKSEKTEKTVLQGAVAAIGGLLLRQLIQVGSRRLSQYIREQADSKFSATRPPANEYVSQELEGDRL